MERGNREYTRIIVYADYREDKSGIPKLIEEEGITVVRRNLSIGDYLVSNEIVVERKTAYDFANSLFDGRLFDQAKRMSESFREVIYVVEGDPTRLRRYRGLEKQLLAALVTLLVDYSAKVIYSSGPRQTAYIIASLARRLEKSRSAVAVRKKVKLETVDDWQEFILQSFPGIGSKTARKIMERFKTLRDFCNASKAELSAIEGIGERRAEFIITILNRRFRYYKGTPRKRVTLDEFYGREAKEGE